MQLLFPEFLWGLLAVGIPVLIHLLQLRRPQRVIFTNTSFIREIELKSGRRRFENLLVLLLRALAVVFLVLAFCQPFLATKLGQAAERVVRVFVDNSASMEQPGKQQLLTTQSAEVGQVIGRSYGDDARLELLGHRGRVLTKRGLLDILAAWPQQQRRLGWGSTPVQQALTAREAGALYVVSDFQRSEVSAGALRRVAAGQEVILLPQAARAVGNIYVDSVWLNDAFVRGGANAEMHVRLRNGGSEVVASCPVKVLVNGRQVAAFQVAVGAGQATEAVVQVLVPKQALVRGEVQVADVPVLFDNTYYFTLRPATTVRVVEIGPAALTRGAYEQEPLFSYHFMQAGQVDFGRLREANVVLLDGVTSTDAALREALVSVVRRGGSVVVVPAARAEAHEATTQLLRELGVGGVQWQGEAGGLVRQEVAMPSANTPFFKDVFGPQARQAAMPSVSPVLQLTGGGTDILRLRDGSGFLTEFREGAGRVYVFSAPFDPAYADFGSHALFVPVLYRLAMLSYRDDQPLAYRIGERTALTLRVPGGGTAEEREAAPYRLVRDSLTLIPTQRQQGQQLRLEVPAELTKPGFYELQRQNKVVAMLAFNAPKAESELAVYSAAELQQLLADRPNVHVLDADEQPAALLSYRAEQGSRPLWRYCLLLALACLLAEGAVLRWGRRTAPQVLASR